MQTSSPLAALQPKPAVFVGHRWNLAVDRPASQPASALQQCGNSFNFKELSMQNKRPVCRDYFNAKPAYKHSSPAATLAVDMCQNLSIDRSPRFPTPRRTLFLHTTPSDNVTPDELLQTPPPTATPGIDMDIETSPLPHKLNFAATQVVVHSPTPEPTPSGNESDCMAASPMELAPLPEVLAPPQEEEEIVEVQQQQQQPQPQQCLIAPLRPERRRPLPMPISRPSLKSKAVSSGQVPMSAGLAGQRPALFNFGNCQRPLDYKPPSLEALDDAFGDSPGKEHSHSAASSIATTPLVSARPRSANQIAKLGSPWNASPAAGRLFPRPGAPAPLAKRRKGYRRANSVFDGSDRFTKTFLQGSGTCMSAIPEFDCAKDRKLPSFLNDASEERIRRITMGTLIDVIDGKYDEHYDAIEIVDCRFEYEYEGGHINGAQNCTDKAAFSASFFPPPNNSTRTLIVFHCEYSAQRAPMTAHFFRDMDRTLSEDSGTPLSYPEIYILDGGYSAFFKVHKNRCFPQSYVEMHDKNHIDACERGMDRINFKQHRRKLSRAHTFALGEREHRIQESPTAPPRGSSCTISGISMDVCAGSRSTPSLPTISNLPVPPPPPPPPPHRSPLTQRSVSY